MKANTFIVGAPKAGTTSLHYYLSQHEEVCMSSIKEPNFFSFQEVSSLYYKAPSISNSIKYQHLFEEDKKIMGEASVSYLFYEGVPQRIYDFNPNAKIIIVLRDPVERAISHFLMDRRLGYCSYSLETILNNKEKHPLYFQQFLELGLYYNQVKRYLDTFGKEQVHILFYADFKTNLDQQMTSLFQFLNLQATDIDYAVKNPFLSSNHRLISYLYKYRWIRKTIKSIVPKQGIKSIKNRFFSSKEKPPFSTSLLNKMKDFYRHDISQLETLLNIDLSLWK